MRRSRLAPTAKSIRIEGCNAEVPTRAAAMSHATSIQRGTRSPDWVKAAAAWPASARATPPTSTTALRLCCPRPPKRRTASTISTTVKTPKTSGPNPTSSGSGRSMPSTSSSHCAMRSTAPTATTVPSMIGRWGRPRRYRFKNSTKAAPAARVATSLLTSVTMPGQFPPRPANSAAQATLLTVSEPMAAATRYQRSGCGGRSSRTPASTATVVAVFMAKWAHARGTPSGRVN